MTGTSNTPRLRAPSRTARAVTLVLAGLGLTGALTGCTDTQPTVIPTPEIVWQDGITPTSPLEAEHLVNVAREADIGKAMASNSGDFTIAQLTDNWDHDYVEHISRSYAGQGKHPIVYPGPEPWTPTRIIEEDTAHAVVEVCAITPGYGRVKGTVNPGGQYNRGRASLLRLELVRVDGQWKRTIDGEYSGGDFGPCDGSSIPVGYFRPAPELPDTPVDAPLPTPTDDEPVHR
ncbi:hypothetical protein SAMN06295974_3919 [Plantibacter flavus]|uniref:Uncharacterized protein n=1 Tax=Plantibacter flavus TaxID=150123 RepID=A0A3N2BY88_9MICO|nr:hypothetical protein [Plantibacter flavus]ROR80230.1 hypothetical protein EDD42_0267 [Plantibacter flavus]SMG50348.1 hypothetical protein SAMN06295974_3919 [Plantibacter flavus]